MLNGCRASNVSSPKFCCCQSGSIKRWGLEEVIGPWGPSIVSGIKCPYKEVWMEEIDSFALPSFAIWGPNKKALTGGQHLGLGPPTPRTMRKRISVLCFINYPVSDNLS